MKQQSSTFQINVVLGLLAVDTTQPVIHGCPTDITNDMEFGTSSAPVYWIPPTATDVSGHVSLVSQSSCPGDAFTVGITTVSYIFGDQSGNNASCVFNITMKEGKLFVSLSGRNIE